MKWNRKRALLFLGLLAALFLYSLPVCAWESSSAEGEKAETDLALSQYDFSALEQFLSQTLDQQKLSFGELIEQMLQGESPFDVNALWAAFLELVIGQVEQNRTAAAYLLALGVCAAVFSGFSGIFSDSQISENAWFATFLIITGVLLTAFYSSSQYAKGCMEHLITFMKLLIPTYSLAIACQGGNMLASAYYELTFFLVTMIEWCACYFLIPGLSIYICLLLLNQMTGEGYLNGLLHLMKLVFDWAVKTISGAAIGLQIIPSMILPALTAAKNTVLTRVVSAVPGIGDGIRSVTEIVQSGSILIKNGIGAAALVVIAVICAIPVVQLAVSVLFYYGTAAILQPVSDRRLTACIQGLAEGMGMLLKLILVSAFLFFITIAVICLATGQIAS